MNALIVGITNFSKSWFVGDNYEPCYVNLRNKRIYKEMLFLGCCRRMKRVRYNSLSESEKIRLIQTATCNGALIDFEKYYNIR